MPSTDTPDSTPQTPLPLTERIQASRDALAASASQAGECHETAGILGWAYTL